jgi:hypothetical protein
MAEIDEWRASQEDEPSRPEALRRLAERGLKADRTDTDAP